MVDPAAGDVEPWAEPGAASSDGFRPLTSDDLPRAAALSGLVGWNQVAADWAFFLCHGQVRGLDDGQEALAATAAVLPYGPDLAWISMVLVRPDRRRQGLATVLLRWALEALHGTLCIALDATPAGQPVYRRLGFAARWGFTRWTLPATLPAEPGVTVRPSRDADWPALLALDHAAFGTPRECLLRGLAARKPALVAEGPHGIRGAAWARDGLHGPQLGPVLAADPHVARALLAAGAAALPTGTVLDLRDAAPGMADWLAAHGVTPRRPFTRMTLGAPPPGALVGLVAVAGPEFG